MRAVLIFFVWVETLRKRINDFIYFFCAEVVVPLLWISFHGPSLFYLYHLPKIIEFLFVVVLGATLTIFSVVVFLSSVVF